MRIYVDMVSSEPPRYRGKDKTLPPWRPHAVRIAAALVNHPVEGEMGVSAVLIATVAPAGSWRCDLDWIRRYAGDTAGLVGQQPASILMAAPWLLAPDATMVAHNAPFHRQVLDGLIADAGGPVVENREWVDTMREATDVCCIPPRMTQQGSKPPSCQEAYRFFAGRDLTAPADLPAREAALQQLNALRVIYWGIRRWGIPDDLEMPAL